jgi:hypothetical protein
MKRIFLVSMYVIASIVQFSCTDDTAQTSSNTTTEKVVADDPGDPNNPIPPIKP